MKTLLKYIGLLGIILLTMAPSFPPGGGGGGAGDMMKITYDKGDKGYVDKAAVLYDGSNSLSAIQGKEAYDAIHNPVTVVSTDRVSISLEDQKITVDIKKSSLTGEYIDFTSFTSDAITEGVTNLFFTEGRFNTAFGLKTTDDLTEGVSNLFYTAAKFDNRFALKTTDNLTQGTTNLYWSDTLFNSLFPNAFTAQFATKTLDDIADGTTYVKSHNDFTDVFKGYLNQDVKSTASPTFSNITITSIPSNANHVTSKGYVDSLISGLTWQAPVLSKTVTAPPAIPTIGDRYIVGTGATGAWTGKDFQIAEWSGTEWVFTEKTAGLSVIVMNDGYGYTYTSDNKWVQFTGGTTFTGGNAIQVSSGVVNLLYDNSFFELKDNSISLKDGSIGSSKLSNITTTSISEGNNLYWTDSRFDTRLALKTTTNLTEGSNLYWTDIRFNTAFGLKTTDDLPEGDTNLYFTTARFDDRFASAFNTNLAGKTTDDLIQGTNNKYWSDSLFDTRISTKSIDDLSDVDTSGISAGHILRWDGTKFVSGNYVPRVTHFIIDYRLWKGELEDTNIHFQIVISQNPDFSSPEYELSTDISQSNWKAFDGLEWIAFPAGGIPSTYAQISISNLNFTTSAQRYVRWRAYDGTNYSEWVGGLI